MKSATPVRRVVLAIIGVLIVLGLVAFSLRTGDAENPGVANPKATTDATFAVSGTTGATFQVTGTVSGLTLGVWKPIAVTIANPNGMVIYVSSLTVAVATDSIPGGCTSSANVDLRQSNVSSSLTVAVPAHSSVMLPSVTVTTPQIRLKNLSSVNQDVCKNKSFNLTYSGTAAP